MKTLEEMKKSPKSNFPEYIIVHHTGGTDLNPLADTSHHTFKTIQNHHLSLGWENIGYHWILEKDGKVVAGRPETYYGAHTTTHNKKSIGIVLSGNFDATLPTKAQIDSLTQLLKDMMKKYNIPKEKIVPHRTFANKTCYGRKLTDDWARNLVSPVEKSVPIFVPESKVEKVLAYLKTI